MGGSGQGKGMEGQGGLERCFIVSIAKSEEGAREWMWWAPGRRACDYGPC